MTLRDGNLQKNRKEKKGGGERNGTDSGFESGLIRVEVMVA